MLDLEARAQTERVQTLEEQVRNLRAKVADAKDVVARAERRARDLEPSLASKNNKATHQSMESVVEVAYLEGQSQTHHV